MTVQEASCKSEESGLYEVVPTSGARRLAFELGARGITPRPHHTVGGDVVRYPEAGHAFHSDARSQLDNAEAASDGWNRTLAWLSKCISLTDRPDGADEAEPTG